MKERILRTHIRSISSNFTAASYLKKIHALFFFRSYRAIFYKLLFKKKKYSSRYLSLPLITWKFYSSMIIWLLTFWYKLTQLFTQIELRIQVSQLATMCKFFVLIFSMLIINQGSDINAENVRENLLKICRDGSFLNDSLEIIHIEKEPWLLKKCTVRISSEPQIGGFSDPIEIKSADHPCFSGIEFIGNEDNSCSFRIFPKILSNPEMIHGQEYFNRHWVITTETTDHYFVTHTPMKRYLFYMNSLEWWRQNNYKTLKISSGSLTNWAKIAYS